MACRSILGVLLALLVAAPVLAANQVTVYANTNGSKIAVFSTADANWHDNHTAGLTAGFPCGTFTDQIGDCASAVTVSLNSGICVVFYRDTYYRGQAFAIHGPKTNAYYNLHSAGIGDAVSSHRFGHVSGGVCTAAWF
jgi:hypothetical protein